MKFHIGLRKGLEAEELLGDGDELLSENLPAKEELRRLKMKLGVWAMAPQIVTPESFWRKELVITLGRPCWSEFTARARDLKTPQDVEQDTVSRSSGHGWASEIHDLLLNGFFHVQNLYPSFPEDEHLHRHMSFLLGLLEKRVQSLSGSYLMPPFRWAGVLSLNPNTSKKTLTRMRQEWSWLLAAERQSAEGQSLKPLQMMHWRRNNVYRLLLLAAEQDNLRGTNEVEEIMKSEGCKRLGDQ